MRGRGEWLTGGSGGPSAAQRNQRVQQGSSALAEEPCGSGSPELYFFWSLPRFRKETVRSGPHAHFFCWRKVHHGTTQERRSRFPASGSNRIATIAGIEDVGDISQLGPCRPSVASARGD